MKRPGAGSAIGRSLSSWTRLPSLVMASVYADTAWLTASSPGVRAPSAAASSRISAVPLALHPLCCALREEVTMPLHSTSFSQ